MGKLLSRHGVRHDPSGRAGENDCGGVTGNSAGGYGYGCALPKLIARYRELWSSTPGTTDPLVPFGIVTLSAGSSEGSGQHMAGMRWSQTGNYGVLPNPIMPAVFMAQGFDAGDPWEMCESVAACGPPHCER